MAGADLRGNVQAIETYGDLRFRISSIVHEGSVIVLGEATHPWPVISLAEAEEAHFAPLMADAENVEILLLGGGTEYGEPPAFLLALCRTVGIAVEPMDTGAAARTFNLLASEGRRVAAALIAV